MKIARYASGAGRERLGIVTQQGGREMLLDAGKASAARADASASATPLPATVMDLIEGSGLTFEDAGIRELKGLHGVRQLYRLTSIQRD